MIPETYFARGTGGLGMGNWGVKQHVCPGYIGHPCGATFIGPKQAKWCANCQCQASLEAKRATARESAAKSKAKAKARKAKA